MTVVKVSPSGACSFLKPRGVFHSPLLQHSSRSVTPGFGSARESATPPIASSLQCLFRVRAKRLSSHRRRVCFEIDASRGPEALCARARATNVTSVGRPSGTPRFASKPASASPRSPRAFPPRVHRTRVPRGKDKPFLKRPLEKTKETMAASCASASWTGARLGSRAPARARPATAPRARPVASRAARARRRTRGGTTTAPLAPRTNKQNRRAGRDLVRPRALRACGGDPRDGARDPGHARGFARGFEGFFVETKKRVVLHKRRVPTRVLVRRGFGVCSAGEWQTRRDRRKLGHRARRVSGRRRLARGR